MDYVSEYSKIIAAGDKNTEHTAVAAIEEKYQKLQSRGLIPRHEAKTAPRSNSTKVQLFNSIKTNI